MNSEVWQEVADFGSPDGFTGRIMRVQRRNDAQAPNGLAISGHVVDIILAYDSKVIFYQMPPSMARKVGELLINYADNPPKD